jgi:hypothetical protein
MKLDLRRFLALVIGIAVVSLPYLVGPERLLTSGAELAFGIASICLLISLGPHSLLIGLLVAGYLAGYVKLRYSSWLGYVLPDGLCVLLLVQTVCGRRDRTIPLPRNGLTVAVLLLTGYCAVEILNPAAPLLRSVLGFRSWMLYTWLIFAGYEMLQTLKDVRRIYLVILVLSIATAIYGLYQWHAGPTSLVGYSAKLDQYAGHMGWKSSGGHRIFRAFSTFCLPGVFGVNMAYGLIVAAVVLASSGSSRSMRYLALLGAPLMLAGLDVSGARYALVAAVVGVTTVLMLQRRRAFVPILLLAVVGLWGVQSLVTGDVSDRFSTILDLQGTTQKWMTPLSIGFKIASENWIGEGLGYTGGVPSLLGNTTVFAGLEETNLDSGIGDAAAELGFGGMLLFIYLLLQLAYTLPRTWHQIPDAALKDYLVGPVAFAVAFASTSVIASMNAALPASVYFWVLIGMVLKAPYLYRTQSEGNPVVLASGRVDSRLARPFPGHAAS